MTTTFLAPDPLQSTFFIPGTSEPGAGVLLFLYANKTTTKQTAFMDSMGSASWTNPIVLDSGGNLPNGGSIYFGQGLTYTAVYAPSNDTDPPGSPYRTIDDLTGNGDISTSVNEFGSLSPSVAAPTPTFVSASTYTIAGDQTSPGLVDVGRRVRAFNTGGTTYAYINSRIFTGGSTNVFLSIDSGNVGLDAGLSAVQYGFLTAKNDSVPLLPGGRATLMDPTDSTKLAGFDLSGMPASTSRMIPFGGLPVSSMSVTSYAILSTDIGKVLNRNGASSMVDTLPVCSSVGAGWYVNLRMSGSSTYTVSTQSNDKIFGAGLASSGVQTLSIPYTGNQIGLYNVSDVQLHANGSSSYRIIWGNGVHGEITYTSSATHINPLGIYTLWIDGSASGGGGGGSGSTAASAGGGGGGGQSVIGLLVNVTPGSSYAVTVSTGGLGGGGSATGAGNPGSTGANTSFDSLLTLVGGSGGSNGLNSGGTGGPAGGAGGQAGQMGQTAGVVWGGQGGGTIWGQGGPMVTGAQDGLPGTGFGAGGSGGTGANHSGSTGAAGFLRVRW